MINLTPYLFESETTIRITDRDGNPWFIAKDVCAAIGIKDHNKAVRILDEDEKGVAFSDTPGGKQEHLIVSESGLYALLLRSHAALRPGTPAHRFRKWVTANLLPQIRKTGHYAHPRPSIEAEEMAMPIADKMKMVALFIRAAGPRAGAEKLQQYGIKTTPAVWALLRQLQYSLEFDLDGSPPTDLSEVN